MECDVAVLGGGPGGYTAAIRAAQLGAKTVCIEKEAELGGTCLRVGCIPTKAWVQTAHALHAAREINPRLGVHSEPTLDFAQANEWKDAVVKQMTGGVATLLKHYGVTVFQGVGRFEDARSIGFEQGDVGFSFTSAIVASGSYPIRPPIPGLESPRCVDSTGLLAQTEIPRRLVVLGGGSQRQRLGGLLEVLRHLHELVPVLPDRRQGARLRIGAALGEEVGDLVRVHGDDAGGARDHVGVEALAAAQVEGLVDVLGLVAHVLHELVALADRARGQVVVIIGQQASGASASEA